MLFDNFMHATLLFQITALLYAIAFVFFVFALWRQNQRFRDAAVILVALAFLANSGVITQRWITAERPPFKTLFETMVFYPWCVSVVFFVLVAAYKVFLLGPFTSAISLSGFVYAAYRPDLEIVNLPPALQSGWFVPHVVTYFIAYAALFASCSLAVLFLVRPVWKKWNMEFSFEKLSRDTLDFGFVTLTFGLVMGAVWGKVAWGNYWSWDPKENWALITWFIYLITIHLRFVRGWQGKNAAILSILGFGAVVFTYLGMSLLPTAESSLHVYQ